MNAPARIYGVKDSDYEHSICVSTMAGELEEVTAHWRFTDWQRPENGKLELIGAYIGTLWLSAGQIAQMIDNDVEFERQIDLANRHWDEQGAAEWLDGQLGRYADDQRDWRLAP